MLVCHGCTLNSTSQPRKLPETCHGSCACYTHDFLMVVDHVMITALFLSLFAFFNLREITII